MASVDTVTSIAQYDEDAPNFDGYQGFGTGVVKLAQTIVLSEGITLSNMTLRLGKSSSNTTSGTVAARIYAGSTPETGSPLATADSISISGLPDISALVDGDPLPALTTATFNSTTLAAGTYAVVLTSTVQNGVVPSWRYNQDSAYPGSGWSYVSAWSQQSFLDYELHIATATTLYWTNTGFRFPYPRWD